MLLAGCGGLGAEAASLLARAGVGRLRIVDRDVVELTNLQRQALFDEADARDCIPKAVAAARHLAAINAGVAVEPVVTDLHAGNVGDLLEGVDLVVDGFDNFEGRYLLNDACVRAGVPWVHGACVGSYGVSTLIVPGKTPCLRCLQPELPAAGLDADLRHRRHPRTRRAPDRRARGRAGAALARHPRGAASRP